MILYASAWEHPRGYLFMAVSWPWWLGNLMRENFVSQTRYYFRACLPTRWKSFSITLARKRASLRIFISSFVFGSMKFCFWKKKIMRDFLVRYYRRFFFNFFFFFSCTSMRGSRYSNLPHGINCRVKIDPQCWSRVGTVRHGVCRSYPRTITIPMFNLSWFDAAPPVYVSGRGFAWNALPKYICTVIPPFALTLLTSTGCRFPRFLVTRFYIVSSFHLFMYIHTYTWNNRKFFTIFS